MKLCLIGSSRFKELYAEYNKKLTLDGHVVYSIATVSTSIGSEQLIDDDKMLLDLVHFLKIQASDAVVVVTDKTRYVGSSTRRELVWAELNGKSIYHDLIDVPAALPGWRGL